MLTNLVDNAIKFNREGGRVSVAHENGLRDRILVEDTGEGIPAQHLPRIFERFYRVDRARSRDLGGTGLGLAIVKHLARAHGGDVAVESKLGEGSTFAIELPKGE
jgi:two-component system phosphate regulon sensor histidine kinase PhoR